MTVTGDLTNGSEFIDNITPNTTGIVVGDILTSFGVPLGAKVVDVTDSSTVEISIAATADSPGEDLNFFAPMGTLTATATGTAAVIAFGFRFSSMSMGVLTAEGEGDSAGSFSGPIAMGLLTATATGQAAGQLVLGMSMGLLTATATGQAAGQPVLAMNIGQLTASATGNALASFSIDGEGLLARQALQAIFLVWGMPCPTNATCAMQADAVGYLNQAMQVIWAAGRDLDYFTQRTRTVAFLASGDGSVAMDSDVQNVLPTIRRETDNRPLRPVKSRSQLDLFGPTFGGQTGRSVTAAAPIIFYIERQNVEQPDCAQVVVHVRPKPSVDTNLLIEVVVEPQRFTWADFSNGRQLLLPHRYAESILLPVAKFLATASQYFVVRERLPALEQQYKDAMAILGVVDPQVPEASKAPKEAVSK